MRRPSPCWAAGLALVAGCVRLTGEPRFSHTGPTSGASAPAVQTAAAARRAVGPSRRLVEAAASDPALEDLALYLRIETASAHDDPGGVERAAAMLVERAPDSLWIGPADLAVARVRRRGGDLAGAVAAYDGARASLAANDPRGPVVMLELAETTAALGDDAGAAALVHELRTSHPRGIVRRRARRLADRLRARHPDWWAGSDARLAEGELRLAEGDGAGALDEALGVLAEAPSGRDRDRARWLRARAERAIGERQQAEATCIALAADGAADLAVQALSTAARWRWNADDDAAAARLYTQLLKRFPDDDAAPDALYALGRIRQEAGDVDGAVEAYGTLARRFPDAKVAEEARWRAGWVRWVAGDHGGAADAFASLADEPNRRTRLAAAYWEGRALESLGQPDARQQFARVAEEAPDTYYGLLAEARLGGRDALAADGSLPDLDERYTLVPAFPSDLPGPHAMRARALHAVGLDVLARRELDAIADAAPLPLLVDAYSAVGSPGSVIRLVRASPDADRRQLYPLGFWDVVQPAAESHGLDPLLVTALIRQESLFFPDAVSAADAHGLMQLLPRTAREVAAASGRPAPDVRTLHRPATNVALGTALLRRLLDRYGGSRVRALAAYNAGEDAVAKWDRRFGDRPDDEFVEMITFRETRDYVKSVLDHWAAYRGLYAASASATSAGSPPNAPLDMMTMTSPGAADATR